MRRRIFTLWLSLIAIGVANDANAEPVERIVAMVNEEPIFLSELSARARPYLQNALSQGPSDPAGVRSEVLRQLLARMIDERLEAATARKLRITVTAEEIERGIDGKAASLGLDRRGLLQEAQRQGLDERDYRAEVARQMLEGKLLQLHIMSRVSVPDPSSLTSSAMEEVVSALRERWLRDLRHRASVDVRL